VPLVRPEAQWSFGILADDEPSAGYHSVWRSYCNAFALRSPLRLVTAAHCVKPGELVRYLPPDGWGVDRAQVATVDLAHDTATLNVTRIGGLVGLEASASPRLGAAVWAASATFGAVTSGELRDEQSGRYVTTMGIVRGWSGSPALDQNGRAWGVVIACLTRALGECADRGAVVGGLL